MTSIFYLDSNNLCDEVPTQVQALSSSVTTGWQVTTGNSFGTMCGWIEDSRFPGAGNTSNTKIDYNNQGITGTIPTEFGLLTDVTMLSLASNELTGIDKNIGV